MVVVNKKFSAIWPNILKRANERPEKFKNIKNKYEKHFSNKPGK